jgi:hypothetical protein
LDELLLREVKQTLHQFGDLQIPGVIALQKLVLRAEETEPLERQMLELLQQVMCFKTTPLIFILILSSGQCCCQQRRSGRQHARAATPRRCARHRIRYNREGQALECADGCEDGQAA